MIERMLETLLTIGDLGIKLLGLLFISSMSTQSLIQSVLFVLLVTFVFIDTGRS